MRYCLLTSKNPDTPSPYPFKQNTRSPVCQVVTPIRHVSGRAGILRQIKNVQTGDTAIVIYFYRHVKNIPTAVDNRRTNHAHPSPPHVYASTPHADSASSMVYAIYTGAPANSAKKRCSSSVSVPPALLTSMRHSLPERGTNTHRSGNPSPS